MKGQFAGWHMALTLVSVAKFEAKFWLSGFVSESHTSR